LSLEDDNIYIGFFYEEKYYNVFKEILTEQKLSNYFTDVAFDMDKNTAELKYLLEDPDNISESIYIFNQLNKLEIKYRKYIATQHN